MASPSCRLFILAATGVIMLSLGACATDEQWATGRDSYPVDRAERGNGMQRPRAEAVMGNPDQFFLMQAAHINTTEIELSRIAADRAGSQQVRDYARMMIDDHTQLNREVLQLAQRMDVRLPMQPEQARRMHREHLQSLSGASFDDEYISMMIADHVRAVSVFESKLQSTTDSNVRNLAEQALPVLRRHLQEAQNISMQLTGNRGGNMR